MSPYLPLAWQYAVVGGLVGAGANVGVVFLEATRWPQGWETAMVESSAQVDADRYPDLYEVRDDPQVRAEISVW